MIILCLASLLILAISSASCTEFLFFCASFSCWWSLANRSAGNSFYHEWPGVSILGHLIFKLIFSCFFGWLAESCAARESQSFRLCWVSHAVLSGINGAVLVGGQFLCVTTNSSCMFRHRRNVHIFAWLYALECVWLSERNSISTLITSLSIVDLFRDSLRWRHKANAKDLEVRFVHHFQLYLCVCRKQSWARLKEVPLPYVNNTVHFTNRLIDSIQAGSRSHPAY